MKKELIKNIIVLLFMISILIVGSIVVLLNNNERTEVEKPDETEEVNYEIVVFKMNPEVILVLDEEKVVEIGLLNEAALIAYSDEDFLNENVVDVVDEMVDIAIDLGYIDEFSTENVLELSVSFSDEDLANRIQERMERRLQQRIVFGEIVKDDVGEAKTVLIRRIQILDENVEEADLLDLSVRELATKMREIMAEQREEIVDFYQKENLEEIKKQMREEMQMIRENVADSIENFRLLTREERREVLVELQLEIRERIENTHAEIREEHGESIRQFLDQLNHRFNREELENKRRGIIEETKETHDKFRQDFEDYQNLTPAERRELNAEIRENVTDYFVNDLGTDLEDFRNSLVERWQNR